MNFRKKTIFSILVFLLLFPFSGEASRLYFESQTSKFGPGDEFSAVIKIDEVDACINAAEIVLEFPQDYLKVKDFLVGSSFFSLWVERPSADDFKEINEKGVLRFVGGIPGGYCGMIPGDPGESNILGKVIFSSPGFFVGERSQNEVELKLSGDSRVVLNDGLGTLDEVGFENLTLQVSNSPVLSDSGYGVELRNDNISPEPFVVYLQERKGMFGGAKYIEFNTVDKQTGIDRYEVLEIWENEEVGAPVKRSFWDYFVKKARKVPEWKAAESPYVLQDQELSSIIKVKAVDKAGNERLVEFIPEGSIEKQQDKILYVKFFMLLLTVIAALIFVFALWISYRRIRRKKKEEGAEKHEHEIDDFGE